MKVAIRYLQTQVSADKGVGVPVLVAVVTTLALVLRLLLLGEDSLWADEIYSVTQAQQDWGALWDQIRQPENMAFYYALLHFWLILGESEFIIRVLSVIPAVLTVPVVYLLGKRLFDAKVGLIAALLLAINAFHIQYSQEARSYSLVVFLVALSSLFLTRGIKRPSWGNWAGYMAVSILAVLSHFFGILVLLGHVVSLIFLPRWEMPRKWIVVSISVISLLATPVVTLLLSLVRFTLIFGPGQTLNWRPEPSLIFGPGLVNWRPETSLPLVYRSVSDLTGAGGDLLLLIYLISLFSACIIATKTWFSSRASFESWKYAFLLLWLLLPVLITLGFSVLVTPAFVSRYLIICLPALVLLAAMGISRMRPSFCIVLLAALVAMSAKGTFAYHADFEKEDWRGAASLAVSQSRPGDGVLFYVPNVQNEFEYYVQRTEPKTVDIDPVFKYATWRNFLMEGPGQKAITERLPDRYNRIWLVLARDHSPGIQRVSNEIQAALRSKYPFALPIQFSGVRLVLFARDDPLDFGGEQTLVMCQKVVEDSSGSGKHGTLVNEPTRTTGEFGEALEFDGNNDYVSLGDIHGFEGTLPFTVSLWTKDSGASGSYDRLVSKESPTGTREGWLIFRHDNQDRYGFERWQDGAKDRVDFGYTSGEWNHIVFTYDGTYMRGYLNGVMAAGPTISSKRVQPTFDSLTIGTRSDAGRDFYGGLIDEVRIYNRALSDAEISELSRGPDDGLAQRPDNSLVANWKFDEGSGTSGSACS